MKLVKVFIRPQIFVPSSSDEKEVEINEVVFDLK